MSADVDSLEAHVRQLRRRDAVAWIRQRVLPALALALAVLMLAGAGFDYALPGVM